jgi:hypothetical protein
MAKFISTFSPEISKLDFEKGLDEITEPLSGTKYFTLIAPDNEGKGVTYSLAGMHVRFDENGVLKTIFVDDSRRDQNSEAIFYNKKLNDYLFWSYPFDSGGFAMWRAVIYFFLAVAGILFYSIFEMGSKNPKHIFAAQQILVFVVFMGFADLFWHYSWQQIQIKHFAETAGSLPIATFLGAGKVWIVYPTYLMNIILVDFLMLLVISWRGKKYYRISLAQ